MSNKYTEGYMDAYLKHGFLKESSTSTRRLMKVLLSVANKGKKVNNSLRNVLRSTKTKNQASGLDLLGQAALGTGAMAGGAYLLHDAYNGTKKPYLLRRKTQYPVYY